MIFKKLKTKNKDFQRNSWTKEFHENWVLILQTKEDVLKYMKLDSEQYALSLRSMRREDKDKNGNPQSNVRLDHLSSNRETVLATYISYKVLSEETERDIYPFEILDHIVIGKTKTLLKFVENFEIQIAENGSWCAHKTFLDIHNPEIITTIEKDSVIFPIDIEPYKSKILILENGTSIENEIYRYAESLSSNSLDKRSITQLKEKDSSWVIKCIQNCEKVVLQTNAVDSIQLDNFMQLFLKMNPKEIHIRTNNRSTIENHSLYKENFKRHQIKFF